MHLFWKYCDSPGAAEVGRWGQDARRQELPPRRRAHEVQSSWPSLDVGPFTGRLCPSNHIKPV